MIIPETNERPEDFSPVQDPQPVQAPAQLPPAPPVAVEQEQEPEPVQAPAPIPPAPPVAVEQEQEPEPEYSQYAIEMRQTRDLLMVANYKDALKSNPEFVAELRTLSQQLGVTLDENSDVESIRKMFQLKAFQDWQLADANPVLAWKMTDPEFAKLAHDQIDQLSGLEDMVKGFSRGRLTYERSQIGTSMFFNSATTEQVDRLLEIDKELQGYEPGTWLGIASEFVGTMSETLPRALAYGLATGTTAAGITAASGPGAGPAFLAGFGTGTTVGMFIESAKVGGGNFFADVRNQGYSEDEARLGAMGYAVVSGLSETLGLKLLGKPLAAVGRKLMDATPDALVRPTLGRSIYQFGKDVTLPPLAEAGTEGFQEFAAIAAEEIVKFRSNPDAVGILETEEGREEFATRIGQAFSTALKGAWVLSLPGAAGRVGVNQRKADEANEAVKVFEAIADGTANQELLKRAPDMYGKFVQDAANQAETPDVYVNAKEFKGAMEATGVSLAQLEEVAPAIAKQVDAAAAVGGDVVIPTGEFASSIASRPEFAKALVPHMRTGLDAFSAAQAEEHQILTKELTASNRKKVTEKMEQDKAFRDSATEVEKEVLKQMRESGRGTKDEQKQFAGMVKLLYSVFSIKEGSLPLAEWKKNPLRIAGEKPQDAGNGLNQIESVPDSFTNSSVTKADPDAVSKLSLLSSQVGLSREQLSNIRARVEAGIAPSSVTQGIVDEVERLIPMSRDRTTLVEDDGFLYHVTTKSGAKSIKKSGVFLSTGVQRSMAPGAYRSYSEGKVFFTDAGGVSYWKGKILEHLQHQTDGDVSIAVVRVPKSSVSGLQQDAVGTSDSGHQAYYVGGDVSLKSEAAGTIKGEYIGSKGLAVFYEKADFSTFVHELAHHYRVMLFTAGRAAEGPTALAADMQTILQSWGLKDLAEWDALTDEQKVKFEEQFARWFEQWLSEGKAPSVELEPVFQRFKNWMKRIYTDVLQRLNSDYRAQTGEDLPVLTGEVRQVFERMLATDQEIDRARAVRGDVDVLEFAEAARKAGLDTNSDEWFLLTELAKQDYAAALDILNSESVRDMQWLKNASIREMKKLQEQHAATRAKVRKEVDDRASGFPLFRVIRSITGGKMVADDGQEVENRLDAAAVEEILVSIYPEERATKRKRTKKEIAEEGEEFGAKVGKEVEADVSERRVYKMLKWLKEKKATISTKAGLLASPAAWRDLHTDETKRHGTVFSESKNAIQPDDAAVQFGFDSAKQMVDELAAAKPVALVVEEESAARFTVEFKPAAEEVGVAPALSAARRLAKARERLGFGKPGGFVTGRGGQSPSIVADMFGFKSPQQMVRAILNTPEDLNVLVDDLTDQIMLAKHSNLADPVKRQETVAKALANEAHAKFVATKLNFLSRTKRPANLVRAAAKQAAKNILAGMRLSEINPRANRAAEARAAANAMKALKEGKNEDAIVYTQQELVQAEMGKLAVEIQKEIKQAKNLFANFNQSDKKVVKKHAIEFVQAGRILLSRIGENAGIQDERAWLEKTKLEMPEFYNAFSQALVYADSVRQSASSWAKGTFGVMSNLTLEEFREFRDYANSLWQMGAKQKEFMLGGKLVEIEAVVKELTDQLATIGDLKVSAKIESLTNSQKKMIDINSTMANLAIVEHVCRYLDGGKPDGIFTRSIFRSMANALDTARIVARDVVRPLAKRFDDGLANGLKHETIELKSIPFIAHSEAELLGLVSNCGNDSSLERVALFPREDGTPAFGSVLPDGTVDTSKVLKALQEMVDIGVLTEERMDFIQSMWDAMESVRPLSQKAHKQIHGYEFTEIEARPLRIKFKDGKEKLYRGGYMPAKYDPYRDAETVKAERLEDLRSDARSSRQQSPSGFTKDRVKRVSKPLRFDISVAIHHIEEAVRFAHVEPVVVDLLKVFRNRDFTRQIRGIAPTVLDDMLLPWLNRSARQVTSTPSRFRGLDQFLRTLRTNSAVNIMFSNPVNAAQQITGITVALSDVTPSNLASGLRQALSKETHEFVKENSEFMRNRMDDEMRVLAEEMQNANNEKTALRAIQRASRRKPYWLQVAVQQPIDVGVWKGKFDQELAVLLKEGRDPAEAKAEAVQRADATVRMTQGSRNAESIAGYEASTEAMKLVTQFTGWSNMIANNNAWKFRSIYKQLGWRGSPKMAYHFLVTFSIPMIIGSLIVNAAAGRGIPDDEDDNGVWDEIAMDYLLMSHVKGLMSMIPVGGNVFMAAIGAWTDKPYDDRILQAPVATTIEQGLRGVAGVATAVFSEERDLRGRDIKDIFGLLGAFFGVPLLWVGKSAGYGYDVARGVIDPDGVYDFIRGIVTGTASPASKQ